MAQISVATSGRQPANCRPAGAPKRRRQPSGGNSAEDDRAEARSKNKMVPRERIELSASPLPRVRSTTELPRLTVRRALLSREVRKVKPSCAPLPLAARLHRMSKDTSREERLAAKLRENLRRRKAQSKAMAERGGPDALSNADEDR